MDNIKLKWSLENTDMYESLLKIEMKFNEVAYWINKTDKIIDNLNEFNAILVKKLKESKNGQI